MASPTLLFTSTFIFTLFTTLLVTASLRLLALFRTRGPRKSGKKGDPLHLLIVLGSGGHTQEMLYFLEDLRTYKYTYRTYVVSSGDAFSAERAKNFEEELERREKEKGWPQYQGNDSVNIETVERENGWPLVSYTGPSKYTICTVPRARKIHQPLLTTPFSALQCLLGCFPTLLGTGNSSSKQPPQDKLSPPPNDIPDAILINGPATAVIFILASYILRFFNIRNSQTRRKMATIYIESFARVSTLSLSGRFLEPFVDRFLVQWPQLAGGRREYRGDLIRGFGGGEHISVI
ncbi:Alg14-domain-containing protein [Delitschia confertaspora ATCC 74209]|uniref:UDP-N-acetylglucosamine transferase subunit ALG14 n=1 Tax=Delitschia confertaspora ATCC 74209 TaxID=1513339 RepID=A0A9P4JJF0_9PLEO|nr:Alg14-domain-containing protein [Delitschia confertaspora ATCC 74209]